MRRVKTKSPKRIEIDMSELQAILQRTHDGPLGAEDHQKLTAAVETLGFLTQALEKKGTSLERLRRLLFGPSTEKTRDVLAAAGAGSKSERAEQEASESTGEAGPEAAASATEQAEKRPGHGRNGAAAYTGAQKVSVPHESLKAGDPCSKCKSGKVYPLAEPAQLVRVKGQAPLMATVYECARLRCNLCGEVFTAAPPAGVGMAKYDSSAAGMLGLLKYGCGMPFNRLERLEGGVGIPLPAATQWDIVKATAAELAPAYVEMVRQAAQGEVLHNDDTTAKILSLMARARAGPDGGSADTDVDTEESERTGVFTTGIVSTGAGHKIALFFTGRQHAGENLADVLAQRAAELGPPIQMCDGLQRNVVSGGEELDTIVGNCLCHSRRKFVEVATRFPPQVRHVLEILHEVYVNEARTHELHMNPTRRLRYHQRHSGPSMKKLEQWLAEQFAEKKVEPNSGLGDAILYMQKHWDRLTLFLRVAGAPIDNNICERVLKKAILHRKNALFFKTENGAHVGDLFMSLIHTAEIMQVDSFDYLVALQQHAAALAEDPDEWMPWNYKETIAKAAAAPLA